MTPEELADVGDEGDDEAECLRRQCEVFRGDVLETGASGRPSTEDELRRAGIEEFEAFE